MIDHQQAAQLSRRRFTVAEYHQMVEAEILTEDDRVELINGEIITMSPIGLRHMACVNRLTMLFTSLFADQAITSVQNPLPVDHFSEPEPDVVLLKYADHFYEEQKPNADDVLLVVEVADSSLTFDRDTKLALYAQAGFPEAWLVNLKDNCLEAYRQAADGIYKQRQIYQQNDSISFLNHSIPLTSILGQTSKDSY